MWGVLDQFYNILGYNLKHMQGVDKKQRRIVPLTPHMSSVQFGDRQKQSASSSRSRKMFKLTQRPRVTKNELLNSFTKKNPKQSKTNGNDYGLDMQTREGVLNTDRNIFLKNTKQITKLEQPRVYSKGKMLKSSGFNKFRKYSDKTNSLDSLIRNVECSTPVKKSYIRRGEKSSGSPSTELTRDSKKYEKTIEHLKSQNEYYEGLYMNSQQRIEALKKQSDDEKKKCERIRKIYQQQLTKMASNKEACQKNLGHIYSYDSFAVDLVPDEVIVENSIQCSIDDLSAMSRKNSESTYSKLSVLSLNSR